MLKELTDFVEKHGNGEAFGFDQETVSSYIKWAFIKDYLFVAYDGSGITAVGIAYPFNHDSYEKNGQLFSFKDTPSKQDEHKYDLCIMDIVSLNSDATKSLVLKFKNRYPHWHSVKKWGTRTDSSKEISNKYINLIH